MRNRLACSALLACWMAFLFSVPVRAQIHPHHAAQIRKAAQEVRPRVAPKKPDEESEAAEGWDKLDNAERVKRTEKELEKAREELKAAEAELARLRRG